MRVLMISAFFPSTHAIDALWGSKFARFLIACGHDVRVVCAVQERIPDTLEPTISPEYVRAVRCSRSKRMVHRQGEGRFRSIPARMAKLWRTLFKIPDEHFGWYFSTHKAAEEAIQTWHPDIVFASAPPVTALIVAHRLSQRHDIPWVAASGGLWADNHHHTLPLWRRKLDGILERRVLASASLLVAETQPSADLIECQLGKPTLVVSRDEQYPRLESRLNGIAAVSQVTVTHVITSLGSGGAEGVLARLAATPGPVRHSVISLMDEGIHDAGLRAQGVSVTTLHMVPGRMALVLPWLRLIRQLRRTRPDIVMTWLYHADLMGSVASLFAGMPTIVWNVRCSNMDFTRYSRLTALVVCGLSLMSGFLPRVIVSNSVAGKRHHLGLGYRARAWQVIPNGFIVPPDEPSPYIRMAVRSELGYDGAVVVGMVARVDAMKNHTGFLMAAAKAAAMEPRLRFVLVGRGTDNPAFGVVNTVSRLGLGARTRLLGERQDVRRLLHGFDLLVSASTFGEGLSNSVGEAMSMGIPCIVTDVGDSALLVGETGEVVPPGDINALAEAILRMASMPADQRQAMGDAARARIQDYYSMPKMIADYTELFIRLGKRLGDNRA